MGLEFDTTSLFLGVLFSSIGFGYFLYGKKQGNKGLYWSGIGLMVYPYFISGTWPMIGVGVALLALPKFLPEL